MTLPDTMDKENAIDARKLKKMGLTLQASIKQALKRKGLTCGMTASGVLLQNDPSTVMMCVMPSNCSNVAVHIHQTLIQAFCRENNILIIELNDDAKLAALVGKLTGRGQAVTVNGNPADTSCVLLQYPKNGPSKHDVHMFQFYEELKTRPYPVPHMCLPD